MLQARLQKEMGQANEKFSQLDEKYKVLLTEKIVTDIEQCRYWNFKGVETERDTLRKKVKETEIKIEVQLPTFMTESLS